MSDLSRRSLLAGILIATPLSILPGCVVMGPGGGTTEGLRRLLGISSQRALARLVSGNGYLTDPEARIALPGSGGSSAGGPGAGGRDDRSAAVFGALLRSAPVQRELTLAVNRAAGKAADRAAPMVYDAIRSLSFADALAIVRGGPTAATRYLEASIGDRILDAMLPEVGDALRQFGGGSILGPVLGAATGIDIVGLQRVVARQAAQGLWQAIGREEAAIRADPRRAGDPLVEAVLTGARSLG